MFYRGLLVQTSVLGTLDYILENRAEDMSEEEMRELSALINDSTKHIQCCGRSRKYLGGGVYRCERCQSTHVSASRNQSG